MTIQTVPRMFYPAHTGAVGYISTALSTSVSTMHTLDAANEAFAYVGPAPASGSLTDIYFRLGATSATGGPFSFDVRLETVNTSGRPSGTLWATNTNAAYSLTGTDDNTWTTNTLTAAATIANAGDPIAIVVKAPGAGTFSLTAVGLGISQSIAAPGVYPWTASDTSAVDGTYESNVTSGSLCMAVKIGGTIYELQACSVLDGSSAATYNSGSSPDEKALRINWPAPVRVIGMRACLLNTAAGADMSFTIWPDSAGTQTDANALAQKVLDGDLAYNTTNDGWVTTFFASAVSLSANTTYWAGVRADTANNIALQVGTVTASPDFLPALPGGANAYQGTRAWSAGSASVFTTSTTNVPFIQLIIDGIDDGAGAGGGGGPLIGGRLVR